MAEQTPDPLACVCDFSPHTTGPEQDCPEHGDVRWYSQMWAEANDEIRRLQGFHADGCIQTVTEAQDALDRVRKLCDGADLQDSQDAGVAVVGTVTTAEVRAALDGDTR